MRYLIALLAVSTVALSPAFADATSAAGMCYSIQDTDLRTLCLARVHKDPGRCYAVQSPDKRAQCLAEVQGK